MAAPPGKAHGTRVFCVPVGSSGESSGSSSSSRIRQRRGAPRVPAGHANSRVGGKTSAKVINTEGTEKRLCLNEEKNSYVPGSHCCPLSSPRWWWWRRWRRRWRRRRSVTVAFRTTIPWYCFSQSFGCGVFDGNSNGGDEQIGKRYVTTRNVSAQHGMIHRKEYEENDRGVYRVVCTNASRRRKDRENRVRLTETMVGGNSVEK